MRKFDLYLVSDATGETVVSVARAALVQFENVEAVQHHATLVRTETQIDQVVTAVTARPGPVFYTLVDDRLRARLIDGCRDLAVPCVPVLDPIIGALGSYLGEEKLSQPGRQHVLDAHYFARIDAMQFVLTHDDGQGIANLNRADIVLVGVSRTSKTPTCIYLANRGIKAANVPLVPGIALPEALLACDRPLIVGLTSDPGRLVQLRRSRMTGLQEDARSDYVDIDAVEGEIDEARRLCARYGWPVLDVTRRSIEETAAAVLRLYQRRGEAVALP